MCIVACDPCRMLGWQHAGTTARVRLGPGGGSCCSRHGLESRAIMSLRPGPVRGQVGLLDRRLVLLGVESWGVGGRALLHRALGLQAGALGLEPAIQDSTFCWWFQATGCQLCPVNERVSMSSGRAKVSSVEESGIAGGMLYSRSSHPQPLLQLSTRYGFAMRSYL